MKKQLSKTDEQLSRIQLCQDIIYLKNVLYKTKQKNFFYASLSSLMIYIHLYSILKSDFFDFMHVPVNTFFRGWVEQTISEDKQNKFSDYEALRKFEFPTYCQWRMPTLIQKLSSVPWELSALMPNDQHHFLFYFGKVMDACLRAHPFDVGAARQIFKTLHDSFTPSVLTQDEFF